MSQNTSTAVMQQRSEAPDSLDFFPTPPWATRALFEHVIGPMPLHIGWDPACGAGDMVKPMAEYMLATAASDVFRYTQDLLVHDFLQPFLPDGLGMAEWIITNPPFVMGEEFISRALDIATHGVAMLTRTAFLEGQDRFTNLFKPRPPAVVAQFSERVPIFKGILRNPNEFYFDPEAVDKKTSEKGVWKKPTSATSYCWLVWANRANDWEKPNWEPEHGTRLVWIPPCRTQLERPGDYPVAANV